MFIGQVEWGGIPTPGGAAARGCVVAWHGRLARENRAERIVFVALGPWARRPCHFMRPQRNRLRADRRPLHCLPASLRVCWRTVRRLADSR